MASFERGQSDKGSLDIEVTVLEMDTASFTKIKPSMSLPCCKGRKMTKHNVLVLCTLTGVFLGIIFGISLRYASISDDVKMIIAFPGEILFRMLEMLVIPLICTSIVTGVAELCKGRGGRIGLHIIIYYLSTTFCAVLIGIGLVLTIKPGTQRAKDSAEELKFATNDQSINFSPLDAVLDLIRNLFPKNLVEAWFRVVATKVTEVKGNSSVNSTVKLVKDLEKLDGSNVPGLLTFSLILGIAIARREGKTNNNILKMFFDELHSVFMYVVMIMMCYAPVGICSLITGSLLRVGSMADTLHILGLYMLTLVLGLIIHAILVLPLICYVITRRNPYKVYAGCFHAIVTIFGIGSSAATLPVTIRCAEENLKIDKRFTRVMLPLGATINMDGTAVFQGVVAITIAQMHSIGLSLGQIITICITGALASIGAAAIPSSGLVVVLLVLQSVGLPTDTVGLLYTVDWILQRLRATVNILGDVIGVCVVSHLNRGFPDNDDVKADDEEPFGGEQEQNV